MDIERLVEQLRKQSEDSLCRDRAPWLREILSRSALIDRLVERSKDWYPLRYRFLPILKENLEESDYRQIEDRCLRDCLIEQLRLSGIEVVTDIALSEQVLSQSLPLRAHRAYHGSGSEFDRFDLSFYHSGQGASSYGYGIYLTEVPSIASNYADEYKGMEVYKKGKRVKSEEGGAPWRLIRNLHEEYMGNLYSMRKEAANSVLNETSLARRKAWLWVSEALQVKDKEGIEFHPVRFLYTVEVPHDNGMNYLYWERPVNEDIAMVVLSELSNPSPLYAEAIDQWLDNELLSDDEFMEGLDAAEKEDLRQFNFSSSLPVDVKWEYLERYTDFFNDTTGESLYDQLSEILGSEKEASAFLRDMGIVGISYPTQYMVLGGGRLDGARNFVIFDEWDVKITDKLRFFRKDDETIYGFTDGKRVFIDERIAPAETPIHEYAHLWVASYRMSHQAEWERLIVQQKDNPLWAKTARRYPELLDEGDLLEELVATAVGRSGKVRLRLADKLLSEDPERSWFSSLKDVVKDIWKWVKGLFRKEERITLERLTFQMVDDFLLRQNPTVMKESTRNRAFRPTFSG